MSEDTTPYCDCTPVVDLGVDGEDRRPSLAVIEAVARAADVNPTDLDPLGNYVDLEALDRLFEASSSTAMGVDTVVQFSVDDWNVFVRGDGRVRVCDASAAAESMPVFERAVSD